MVKILIKKFLLTRVFFFFTILAKMSKYNSSVKHDQNIIDALKKLPPFVKDKKHNMLIYFDNSQSRSNETRFEHIAKFYHELKVRDIELIPKGINRYVRYVKDKELKETYCYYINRGGKDDGFIKVAVKLYEGETKKAYVKSIFITYRIK